MLPLLALKPLTQRHDLSLRGRKLLLERVYLVLQQFEASFHHFLDTSRRIGIVRRPCCDAQGSNFKFERLHGFKSLFVLLRKLRASVLCPGACLRRSRAARIELALGIRHRRGAQMSSHL